MNQFNSVTQPPRICFLAVTRVFVGSTSFFPAGLQVPQGSLSSVYFCVPAATTTITAITIPTVASTLPTKAWSADTENK